MLADSALIMIPDDILLYNFWCKTWKEFIELSDSAITEYSSFLSAYLCE